MRIKVVFLAGAAALAALMTQSAGAADVGLPPAYNAPVGPAVPPSHWNGFYVSGSAGGTWTRSTLTESSTSPFFDTQQNFTNGLLDEAFKTSGVDSFSSNLSGKNGGAVFTFTTGYNFVWSSWLFGIQSETSWNLSKTRL
jgi:predicted outer membrane repeat protein